MLGPWVRGVTGYSLGKGHHNLRNLPISKTGDKLTTNLFGLGFTNRLLSNSMETTSYRHVNFILQFVFDEILSRKPVDRMKLYNITMTSIYYSLIFYVKR